MYIYVFTCVCVYVCCVCVCVCVKRSSDKSFTPSLYNCFPISIICLSDCQLDDEARAQSIKSTAVNFFGGWGNSGDEEDDSIKPGAVQRSAEHGDMHQAAQDDDSSVESTSVLVRESIESRAPPMASLLDAAGGKRLIEKVSIHMKMLCMQLAIIHLCCTSPHLTPPYLSTVLHVDRFPQSTLIPEPVQSRGSLRCQQSQQTRQLHVGSQL